MPPTSANELTPPAEQVERFRRDLEAITGEAPSAERKLGVAVSGGADSLALLLLAAAAYPGHVVAATVDHGLRPEAADEAAFVHALCQTLGVAHEVLTPLECHQPPTGNLQERARELRYMCLEQWAGGGTDQSLWRAAWVATAHQRDDVAESFLMRARRGAGVGGLAEMRARRPIITSFLGPPLVRPMLRWSRAELSEIAAAAGLEAVQDPSNAHPRFDRSRMRQLLAMSSELPPARLALAARNLRHAEDALDWAAAREWRARAHLEGATAAFDPEELPYELRRRLAKWAVEYVLEEALISSNWRGTGLDRLVATLDSGGTGTIAGVKACTKRGEWRFSVAPARRSH